MNRRVQDLLPDYLLGHLGEEERRYVDDLARESPDLAREIAAFEEALTTRALVLEPLLPVGEGRSRLLDTLSTIERFRPFLATLSHMVDLPRDAVQALLRKIDEPHAWEEGPFSNLSLIHFEGGARVAEVDTGFVRLVRGGTIPRHRHVGVETTLVLEGVLWEDGRPNFPGSLMERPAGTIHALSAGEERDLVFVVAYSGIEVV